MKNTILLILCFFFNEFLTGQNCNDLFVSEIVFSKIEATSSEEETQLNHSIEIFNPTSSAINLSNYQIELIPKTGQNIIITLEGIVPPEDVFVISNFTANIGIKTISDALKLLLSFEDKIAIHLTKNSGVIVDMIGRQDVTNSGAIDLNSLLNDPNYLNDLEINLESIQNLVVRRKRFVRKGNLNFANEDLLEEWAIYPNFEISDLGQHINACLVPVLKWDGVDIFTQEDERFEDEINLPVFGTIVISEPLTESITIFIENVFSEYLPSDPQASSFFDFSTPIDPFDDLTIDAGTESIDYLLLTTELDFQEEGDEGTGFQFDIVNAGNSGAVVEFNGDLFDIKIKEMTTSISDLNPSIDILISPTLVNTHLTLESNDSQLSFESLTIVGLDSKASRVEKLNGGNRVTVNLSSFHSRGLHVLNIKTNKGTITKKIFKF